MTLKNCQSVIINSILSAVYLENTNFVKEMNEAQRIDPSMQKKPAFDVDLNDVDDRQAMINNIDRYATVREVSQALSVFGKIEYVTVFNRFFKKTNRRYGYVVYSSRTNMLLACAAFICVRGKKISVSTFKRKLLITGFHESISVYMLKRFFSQYGPIFKIEVVFDTGTNVQEAYCFLTFATCWSAKACLRHPTKVINGRYLNVVQHSVNWNGIDLSGKRVLRLVHEHIWHYPY